MGGRHRDGRAPLGINPFDEPNVQQAKDATRELLARYSSERRLPIGEPDAVVEGVRITLTAPASAALDESNPLALLSAVRPGDYVGLLAYVPPEDERFAPVLEPLRTGVATRTSCATTVGYGPRYLHSTGQLHKGGPNTGVFVIVTAEPPEDLPVPDAPYSSVSSKWHRQWAIFRRWSTPAAALRMCTSPAGIRPCSNACASGS